MLRSFLARAHGATPLATGRLAGRRKRPRLTSCYGHASHYRTVRRCTSQTPCVRFQRGATFAGTAAGVFSAYGTTLAFCNSESKLLSSAGTCRSAVTSSVPEQPMPTATVAVASSSRSHMLGSSSLACNIISAVRLLLRAVSLGIIFSPTIAITPFALISPTISSLWYSVLVWCFSKAGPTFIKLGQWLSTRPDIFPLELCTKLSCFHEQVAAEVWSPMIQETIEAATCDAGQRLSDIFVAFDRVPIGAGCVAQVYRAMLRQKCGESDEDEEAIEVVVKVKRTEIDAIISLDLHLLQLAAKAVSSFFPSLKWIGLEECTVEFSELLQSQLDLRQEAANLISFRRNFKEWGDTIGFPRPIPRLSSRNVLIESYEAGASLSLMMHEEEKHTGHGFSRSSSGLEKAIADTGSRAFFEMVLVHNFVHADLHPGNILVQTRGRLSKDKKTHRARILGTNSDFRRLVFLDAGLTTSLSHVGRRNFIDLFSAVCDADGERAARLMVERSKDPHLCRDVEGFVAGMRGLIDQVADTTFSLGQVRIGEVLLRVLDLCQRHHVRVDNSMAQLVSSIAILDGIGRQLDPDRDLFDTARPILKRVFSLHPDYQKVGISSLSKVVGARRFS